MPKDTQQIGSSFSAASPAVRSYVWIFQIAVLAAAYFVTGKLGTFLAIPPGYATAIWLPSGIALGGILIYGYRAWPGILLGSFLVNFSTLLVSGSPTETLISAITTLVIGGGASLQAIAGAYLVGRFAGFPNPLTRERGFFIPVLWRILKRAGQFDYHRLGAGHQCRQRTNPAGQFKRT